MSSKYHNFHKSSPGFYHSLSAPATSKPSDSCWFRDQSSKTLSPKSDDSDRSFDSDEENVAMETDCHMANDNLNGTSTQRTKFVLKAPLLSSVMSSTSVTRQQNSYSNSKPFLSGGSSKSLVVGRPIRAVGLKDMDLTKNTRAEEIRRAKAANRRRTDRHMVSPILLHSASYPKEQQNSMAIGYHGNAKGINNIGVDDDYGMIINSPPPEYSSLEYNMRNTLVDKNQSVIVSSNKSKASNLKNQGNELILYSEFNDSKMNCDNEFTKKQVKDVIEIDDDDDDNDYKDACSLVHSSTLSDQKACRKRFIEKQPKKRSSSSYFSDDEDDDNVEATKSPQSCKSETSADKSLQKSKPTKGTMLGLVGTFVTIVVLTYFYLHFNPLGLCLDSEFRVNLTGLEEDLKQDFYGQHLAMRVLLSSLKSHTQGKRNKPLVLSLHGWTGTGKNHVSGIIAKHLFKHGTQSNFVHKFIIPLHFPHVSDVDLYRKQLRKWITGSVTKCNKGGLFIFDEMDKIPDGIVSILKPFLDTKGSKSALDLNRFVFLFLSNSGGKLINQHVIEHYKQGKARETIDLVSLEGLLNNLAETNPRTWYNELLKSEVIDYFIPFLPLERSHVKQCVRRDMRTKGYIILDKMVTEVTNEMSFFPQDIQLFSVAGCKKVSSKVDVAMG